MTIERLNINGKVQKNQDFLDLVLTLNNPQTHSIVVMYKEDGKISRDKKTRYIRNNQGQWYRTMDKGVSCNTKVEVVKENKQYIIKNV